MDLYKMKTKLHVGIVCRQDQNENVISRTQKMICLARPKYNESRTGMVTHKIEVLNSGSYFLLRIKKCSGPFGIRCGPLIVKFSLMTLSGNPMVHDWKPLVYAVQTFPLAELDKVQGSSFVRER